MDNKIYPFKFLDSYTAEDKDLFFGRDEEVRQLYQMIYQSDILLLYGASGTGKTSLIQCGLASQFQQHDWLDVFIRRHKNLNESLRKALIAVGGEGATNTATLEDEDWLDHLMEEGQETTIHQPLSSTQTFLKNIYLQHFRPIYLIFDQFEELFILGTKAEQNQFIATIKEILAVEQPVKLIFSIREEYLGSLYEFEKVVPELLRKKLRIDPMNLEKVKAVVLGATGCQRSIVHIEPTEADAIAEQVFEKIRGKDKTLTIQLPYLQVFLDKYYRHISKDKAKDPSTEATFTLAALQEIGDIGNILRDFLDEQILEIAKQQHCDPKIIWTILSPFVTVDGTKEPIGITTLYQQLPDVRQTHIEQVVLALMNNRILRYLEEAELYEVAHDSLALRIAEKRSDDDIALLEVRHLIKTQSLLKDEARELFSEKQLEFINPYLKQIPLNAEEAQLLESSREQVAQLKQEANRKKLLLLVLAALVFIIISAFAIYSQKAKVEAENEKTKAITAKENAVVAEKKAKAAKVVAENAVKAAKAAKIEAENAEKKAKIETENAVKSESRAKAARVVADLANKKNKKIINAMDFYQGNLALAFNNGKYGFINKNGDPVIPYEYDRGEPFDPETGYAEMEIAENKYLVDASSQRYRLINISDFLNNRKDITTLIDTLNKNNTKLALDFSSLDNAEILSITQKISEQSSIKDSIALLFLKYTDLNTLPNSISSFKNLKWLDLSYSNITALPSSLGNLSQLVRLDLDHTNIQKLPPTIEMLTQLKKLSISGELETIPENIGKLTQLEALSIDGVFETIPESIGKLTQLKSLGIYGALKTIPESIGKLTQLKSLDIYGELKTIPESIGSLTQLEFLDIYGEFETIPESIGNLTQLESLKCYGEFETIPESIGKLAQLKSLDIYGALETIPESIGKLAQLKSLSIDGAFKAIPESIGKLTQLKSLSINGALETIPENIGKLAQLEFLDIYGEFETIPGSIGKLAQLKSLDIYGEFKAIPESIGKLAQLKKLSIDGSLETIPESIGNLTQLKSLVIDGAFKAIPESIGKLTQLESLKCYGAFKTIPESIGKLTQLKTLEFYRALEAIPESIGNLTQLEALEFYGVFKTIPESIGNLTQLKTLSIDGAFETIPDDFGQLINLQYLNIYGKLKVLPDNFRQLTNLKEFHSTLDNNKNYKKNKAILLAFQKENPDCTLSIHDENGNPIDLSKE
ncbi:MAG: leucine-rich repeat domain-containing protein [Aureispira sp.]